MTQPNIKEEIRKLVELQDIDKKLYDLNKEKEQLPAALSSAQDEYEAKKSKFKTLEETHQKIQIRQKEKELELATKEDGIKKAQGQLGQLKTNKEYHAKLSEIESLKADKSIIEEDILKSMDEIDTLKKDIETEKKLLQGDEKIFNDKKSALLLRGKEIDTATEVLNGKRTIYAGSVSKKILESYEHILHGKEGMALAKVKNTSCEGCYMSVPHQVINEIKMHERLITCDICSRILYLEEDIQV